MVKYPPQEVLDLMLSDIKEKRYHTETYEPVNVGNYYTTHYGDKCTMYLHFNSVNVYICSELRSIKEKTLEYEGRKLNDVDEDKVRYHTNMSMLVVKRFWKIPYGISSLVFGHTSHPELTRLVTDIHIDQRARKLRDMEMDRKIAMMEERRKRDAQSRKRDEKEAKRIERFNKNARILK